MNGNGINWRKRPHCVSEKNGIWWTHMSCWKCGNHFKRIIGLPCCIVSTPSWLSHQKKLTLAITVSDGPTRPTKHTMAPKPAARAKKTARKIYQGQRHRSTQNGLIRYFLGDLWNNSLKSLVKKIENKAQFLTQWLGEGIIRKKTCWGLSLIDIFIVDCLIFVFIFVINNFLLALFC